MTQLVYDLVSTQLAQSLKGLKECLLKAKIHAEEHKFSPNLFLDLKLAPDMFNLTKQVQLATDNAKNAVGRLSLKEPPRFDDQDKTFEDVMFRLDRTIEYVVGHKPQDFSQYGQAKVSFPWNPGKYLEGHDYLVTFALPNFYFHATTVYALLRHAGVALGKSDYLGNLNWKNL